MEAAVAAAGITSGVVTAVTATIKSKAFTFCFFQLVFRGLRNPTWLQPSVLPYALFAGLAL